MNGEDARSRISRISTQWDLLDRAHPDQPGAAEAQTVLLRRYYAAVCRYLVACVGDTNTAEDLSQEFALRFVRGDFRRADSGKGRFRKFLKAALQNLVTDHRRRQRARPGELPAGADPPARPDEPPCEEWDSYWRAELLAAVWEGLRASEKPGGAPLYTVLHWRAGHPESPLSALADELRTRDGQEYAEGNLRQILHRARKRFAELLLKEVGQTLETDDRDRIEQELGDLNLLAYCKPALDRRDPPV
jgi:RNA polymerase sigma-70 factor (ECF subfamily)